MSTGWHWSEVGKGLRNQKFEPVCIAIDMHGNAGLESRYEYVFNDSDYVLKQYFRKEPEVTIEDHWSDEVLAFTQGDCEFDNVRCAEMLFETAKGTKHVSKDVVEQIIYKLMVGDLKLIVD